MESGLAANPSSRLSPRQTWETPPDRVRGTLACYGLTPGYLLFVGTLEPRKNLPGLLTAYRILLSRGVNREPLVVVGSRGWFYDEVFARVEALGLGAHVRFLENVPDEDLPALYSGAVLLVMPSFYEGFGLPALEALACGTPVVLSDRGSLPEVGGEAAVYVNPDSPEEIAAGVARVLEDPDLRERLRAAGLAHAARFTWEETARKTLNIYLQVAGG